MSVDTPHVLWIRVRTEWPATMTVHHRQRRGAQGSRTATVVAVPATTNWAWVRLEPALVAQRKGGGASQLEVALEHAGRSEPTIDVDRIMFVPE